MFTVKKKKRQKEGINDYTTYQTGGYDDPKYTELVKTNEQKRWKEKDRKVLRM